MKLLERYKSVVGIASYPYHAIDVKDLLEKADKAMYFAKHSGGNQCKIYNQELDKLINIIQSKE